MANHLSEQDIYSLARQLAPKFTLDKYKSLLIENNFISSRIFDDPYGVFSKILVKEEYIRTTLLYLDYDKLQKLIELFEEEDKLPKEFKRFLGLAQTGAKIEIPKSEKQPITPSLVRKLRVFLCHSSADKPAVRALYQKLSMKM